MSGHIPRALNRDNTGKAPQKSNLQLDLNDFSPSKIRRINDDQTQRNWPRPNPRISPLLLGPKEGGYAKRTLAPDEADPTDPVLRIGNEFQHFVFLDIPGFIDLRDLKESVNYKVFGEEKRVYDMVLSRVSIHGSTQVVHFSDWERIVRDHSLKPGDEVSFDRYLDSNISDDFFYILKYTRRNLNPLDADAKGKQKVVSEPINVEVGSPSGFNVTYPRLVLEKIPDQVNGNRQGQGSRYLPPEAYCLTKTLSSHEVAPIKAKLYLTLTDAVVLSDNPRIAEIRRDRKYSKDIDVFDGEDRRYQMTLNHNFAKVDFEFCLGGEWVDFVSRHDLEEGDQVTVYKVLDSTVSVGYYHVVRYVKSKPTDGVRIMNDSVRSAGGNTREGSGSRSLTPIKTLEKVRSDARP